MTANQDCQFNELSVYLIRFFTSWLVYRQAVGSLNRLDETYNNMSFLV